MKNTTWLLIFITLVNCVTAQQITSQKITDTTQQKSDTPKFINGLIYVVDAESSAFMVPYIEQKLKNLRLPGSGLKLFDTVSNLNTLTLTNQIGSQLITNLVVHKLITSTADNDTAKKAVYKDYPTYLRDYSSVLIIKITPFQNLIEFQFTLFKDNIENNELYYKSSSSVFIDPAKDSYRADLIRTIQQVFVEAGNVPYFEMQTIPPIPNADTTWALNPKRSVSGIKYYLSTKDVVVFDPSISDNSPEADRVYFWKQLQGPTLKLKSGSSKQQFTHLPAGVYKFAYSFTNGTNNSKVDTLFFNVYTPPKIKADYGHNHFYYSGDNQLYIHHHLFLKYTARLDASFNVIANPDRFAGKNLILTYNMQDQSGNDLLQNRNVLVLSDSTFKVDRSLDTMKNGKENNLVGHLPSGSYLLIYQAHTGLMKSDTLNQEVVVYQRSAISFIAEGSFFPFKKLDQVNSASDLSLGANFKFSDHFSMDVLEMSNILNSPLSRYYTNILANYDHFDNHYGIGTGVLFEDGKNGALNTIVGVKAYVKVWNYFNGELRLAASFYSNFGNVNILGFHISRTFSF